MRRHRKYCCCTCDAARAYRQVSSRVRASVTSLAFVLAGGGATRGFGVLDIAQIRVSANSVIPLEAKEAAEAALEATRARKRPSAALAPSNSLEDLAAKLRSRNSGRDGHNTGTIKVKLV